MNIVRSKWVGAVAALVLGIVFAGCSEMVSRDDFAARVKDKSDVEVAKLVGKPAEVDSSKPNEVTWTYNARTFNVDERNKFDSKAVVVFAKGDGKLRAVDVRFE